MIPDDTSQHRVFEFLDSRMVPTSNTEHPMTSDSVRQLDGIQSGTPSHNERPFLPVNAKSRQPRLRCNWNGCTCETQDYDLYKFVFPLCTLSSTEQRRAHALIPNLNLK